MRGWWSRGRKCGGEVRWVCGWWSIGESSTRAPHAQNRQSSPGVGRPGALETATIACGDASALLDFARSSTSTSTHHSLRLSVRSWALSGLHPQLSHTLPLQRALDVLHRRVLQTLYASIRLCAHKPRRPALPEERKHPDTSFFSPVHRLAQASQSRPLTLNFGSATGPTRPPSAETFARACCTRQ